MNYFVPQMRISYKLYKMSKTLMNECDNVFEELHQHLKSNVNFKKFCKNSNFIQKNNSYILLYKFGEQLKYIDQIVMQFDIEEDCINYDISIYCKQQALDHKFYYPIQNVLNKSAKTFDKNNSDLSQQLNKYFDDVFNKYFQIYNKNIDNGLYV